MWVGWAMIHDEMISDSTIGVQCDEKPNTPASAGHPNLIWKEATP